MSFHENAFSRQDNDMDHLSPSARTNSTCSQSRRSSLHLPRDAKEHGFVHENGTFFERGSTTPQRNNSGRSPAGQNAPSPGQGSTAILSSYVMTAHPVLDALAILIILSNLPNSAYTAIEIFFISWFLPPVGVSFSSQRQAGVISVVADLLVVGCVFLAYAPAESLVLDVARAFVAARLCGNEISLFSVVIGFSVLARHLGVPIKLSRGTHQLSTYISNAPQDKTKFALSISQCTQRNAVALIRDVLAIYIMNHGLASVIFSSWPDSHNERSKKDTDNAQASLATTAKARRRAMKALKSQPLWASVAGNLIIMKNASEPDERHGNDRNLCSWEPRGTCLLEVTSGEVAFACNLPIQVYLNSAIRVNGMRWDSTSVMPNHKLRDSLAQMEDDGSVAKTYELFEWTVLISGLAPVTEYEIEVSFRGRTISTFRIRTLPVLDMEIGSSGAQPATALAALPSLNANLLSSKEMAAKLESQSKQARRDHDKRLASKKKDMQLLEKRLNIKLERERAHRKLIALQSHVKIANEKVEQSEQSLEYEMTTLRERENELQNVLSTTTEQRARLDAELKQLNENILQTRHQVAKTNSEKENAKIKVEKAVQRRSKAQADYERSSSLQEQHLSTVKLKTEERRKRRDALKAEFQSAIHRVEKGIEQYSKGLDDFIA